MLNGLLKRKDWQEAVKTPVGLICAGLLLLFPLLLSHPFPFFFFLPTLFPSLLCLFTGQSNSLAFALRTQERALDATLTALEFLKGKTQQLNVMSVTKGSEVTYSLAGQSLGFLDEIPSRFTQSLDSKFKGLINKPKFPDHPCKLSLLVATNAQGGASTSKDGAGSAGEANHDPKTRVLPALDKEVSDWKVIESVAGVFAGQVAWSQKGYQMTPQASFKDGLIDVCVVNQGVGKLAGPRVLKLAETVR